MGKSILKLSKIKPKRYIIFRCVPKRDTMLIGIQKKISVFINQRKVPQLLNFNNPAIFTAKPFHIIQIPRKYIF